MYTAKNSFIVNMLYPRTRAVLYFFGLAVALALAILSRPQNAPLQIPRRTHFTELGKEERGDGRWISILVNLNLLLYNH
jgi:hypothetical protein